jgi:CheY-like chemotaxis protein
MPPTNPRIIVVDDNEGLYDIVRSTLDLLGRRPRLIQACTGDDALTEIRLASADLLVTAFSLVNNTNGANLAMAAKRELAALPVIVLANEYDEELDPDELAQAPFEYLRRPLAPEAFVRAVRVALDGPEAVSNEIVVEDVIPVPAIDVDRLRPLLFNVMRDVGAMATIFADRNGKVLAYEGAAGYIDRDLLAAALGPGFGSTTKLLSIVGDQPRVLKYYDGEKGDLFGLAVGLHHFLVLIFDGNAPGSALGNVKRFGGNTVNEMIEIMGVDTAFSLRPTVAAEPMSPKRARRTQEMPPVEHEAPTRPVAPPKKRTSSHKKVQLPEPEEQVQSEPMFDAIENFDPSLLDALGNVDLNAAEDLFSDENLLGSTSAGGNTVSFEDAMMQGIIDDIEE